MKCLILFFVLFSVGTQSFSQTLERKWEGMINRANEYKSRKIIKPEELELIWHEIQDTLLLSRIKLKLERNKLKHQEQQIQQMKARLSESNLTVSRLQLDVNNNISRGSKKQDHILMLWLFVGLVLLVCLALFFLYKKNEGIAKQKKKDYDKLFHSFEDYKATRLDVERKLRRELQNYINRIEELKGKSE